MVCFSFHIVVVISVTSNLYALDFLVVPFKNRYHTSRRKFFDCKLETSIVHPGGKLISRQSLWGGVAMGTRTATLSGADTKIYE